MRSTRTDAVDDREMLTQRKPRLSMAAANASSCWREGDSPEEFLEHTKLELFQDQVFCFTPKGG